MVGTGGINRRDIAMVIDAGFYVRTGVLITTGFYHHMQSLRQSKIPVRVQAYALLVWLSCGDEMKSRQSRFQKKAASALRSAAAVHVRVG